MPLTLARPGETVTIRKITGRDAQRQRLAELGFVVDTHVKRISKKLGLPKEDDPEKVEYELMKVLPKDHWILYYIQIITLGRTICKAPTPKCGECFLTEWCKDYQNRQKKESRKKK